MLNPAQHRSLRLHPCVRQCVHSLNVAQVLHPSFKEGTFNAGLMSTEAGTLGRFTGNALLTLAGNLAGLDTRVEVSPWLP